MKCKSELNCLNCGNPETGLVKLSVLMFVTCDKCMTKDIWRDSRSFIRERSEEEEDEIRRHLGRYEWRPEDRALFVAEIGEKGEDAANWIDGKDSLFRY